MILRGRVWKLGDNISATDVVPSRYDMAGMSGAFDECAKHILEDVDPGFVANIRQGDLFVAGKNFGMGHAHYFKAAVMGCWRAGISGIIAEQFNAIFHRVAIDLGYPSWSYPQVAAMVKTGDELEVDLRNGSARNHTTGASAKLEPVPALILDIFEAGGSEHWALKRIGAEHAIAR